MTLGKKKKTDIFLSILVILLFFFYLPQNNTYAIEDGLNATVKVSLCGDNLAEGREHCDGMDIPNQECTDWGYDEGLVMCDLSCHYDFSNCYSYPEEEEEEVPDETPVILNPIIQYIILPPEEDDTRRNFLRSFDLDNNGLIESSEIPDIVVKWVNAWTHEYDEDYERKSRADEICDLNQDNSCDVKDFSTLMFLINNEDYEKL